ncbi:hypothetical protein E2C01_039551 [Portunus trituberculatus]|uniref:Uncharacterized protein n=1 Tax=Portunus trituberculatus TaxID=210409 RepID=A0A5B7FK50_PORTR|nr:hypothetical protein [Portunus trituberculatus]
MVGSSVALLGATLKEAVTGEHVVVSIVYRRPPQCIAHLASSNGTPEASPLTRFPASSSISHKYSSILTPFLPQQLFPEA